MTDGRASEAAAGPPLHVMESLRRPRRRKLLERPQHKLTLGTPEADMELGFYIEAEDVVCLQEHMLELSPSHRANVRKAQLTNGVGFLIGVAAVSVVARSWWGIVVGLPFAFVAAAATPQHLRLETRKRIRAFLSESPQEHWEGIQRVVLTDDGLAVSSNSGTGTIVWSAIERVDETDTHLIIGLGGLNGLVVPRARLQTGDLAAFAQSCRSRLSARGA